MTRVQFPSAPSGAKAPAPAATTPPAAGDQPAAPAAAVTPPATAAPERPSWLPEKFKTPEDFAASYKALETKLGAPAAAAAPAAVVTPPAATQPPAVVPTVVPPAAAPTTPTPAEAAKVVGADEFKVYSQEFAEKGELSPDTFAKLEAKGIPKEMVQAYIQGQQLIAEQSLGTIYAEAGGSRETYVEMAQWADKNLPDAEKASFNTAVESSDLGVAKLAVQALYAKFKGEQPPVNITSSRQAAAAQSGLAPFASSQEMVAAMNDPRYAKDPAYRAQVRSRIQ